MREISLQMVDHNIPSFWWKELVKHFVQVGDKLEIRCWKEEFIEIQQATSYGNSIEDNYEVSAFFRTERNLFHLPMKSQAHSWVGMRIKKLFCIG